MSAATGCKRNTCRNATKERTGRVREVSMPTQRWSELSAATGRKSEMTLDHSFLSDSRNFFVWPRVISVHSYYLTSLVTSHFCRLTIFTSLTDPLRNSYFHSIQISLSAGSSYMSAEIRRMESPEWLLQRMSCHLMALYFPLGTLAKLLVYSFTFCFWILSFSTR